MIYKFIILCMIFININISKSEELKLRCSGFKGYSVEYESGRATSYDDGFSGQQIEFIIPIPPQAGSIVNITWKGRNQREDQGVFTMASKDGWVTFTSFHSQVLRTYVLYTAEAVMALTETQTRVISNSPQIRTMYSRCNPF